MNLTELPLAGVSRDTATTAAPAGLVGVAEGLNQTGVFIYTKNAVKVWVYSNGAWSSDGLLTGAAGSRTHVVDWASADRLWVQSLEAESVEIRMVAQTGALGHAQLGNPVSTWSGLTDTPGSLEGEAGKFARVKMDETGMELIHTASNWLGLEDCQRYGLGTAGRFARVKMDGSGIELIHTTSNWVGLTDTPFTFFAKAGKYIRVKENETGLEYCDAPAAAGSAGLDGQIQWNDAGDTAGAQAYYDNNNHNFGLNTSTFNTNMSNSVILNAGYKPTAGVTTQATITAARESVADNVDIKLLCHFEDLTDEALDNGTAATTVAGSISATEAKFGTNSLKSTSGADSDLAWSISAAGTEYNPGTDDFTIEFWMNSSMVSGSKFVFGTDAWSWGGPAGQIAFLGNRLYLGNTAYTSGMTIPADTWTHIAIQRRNGDLEYYMNGVGTGTVYTNWGGDLTSWAGFSIGRDAASNYGWNGYIDEFAVFIGSAKYTGDFTVPTEAHSAGTSLAPAELWVGDGSNNLTQISPHNADGEWEFFSKNVETGRVVRVNMERMIKRLEEIHGETFMEEWTERPSQNDPSPTRIDASSILPEENLPE